MNKINMLLISMLFGITAFSQTSIDSVLVEVERNNTTLAAYRNNVDAEKMGNKTGLLPSNPEVEFNYLWGSPELIGNRTDIAISQEFDFPTTYVYKSQIASMKNEQAELEYKKQRYHILLQTRLLCSELTHLNSLYSEYKKRLNNDSEIANSYKRKMEVGEATILEHHKAQISLLNTEKQLEQINIERTATLQQLAAINAGKSIEFADSVFVIQPIDTDFEQWYATAASKNPMLSWLKQEIAISEKEKQLQTSQSLPKLSTGYMSEKVVDEQFQGITLGISIPLWGNKNTVKHAKLKALAVQSMEADARVQFYNEMKILHTKTIALQNSINDFKQRLSENNNLDLLTKALQEGELSLSEYFFELMVFYDSKEELLQMEKKLQNCVAQLEMYD